MWWPAAPFVKANLHLTRPLIHTMLSTTGHSVPRAPLSKDEQNPTTTKRTPIRTHKTLTTRPSTRSHTPVQTTQGVQSDDTTLAARCLHNVRRARCQDLVYTPPSPQLPRPKRPHTRATLEAPAVGLLRARASGERLDDTIDELLLLDTAALVAVERVERCLQHLHSSGVRSHLETLAACVVQV